MHVSGERAPTHAPLDLSQVLERVTDAFLALDLDWRLTYVNSKTEALMGASREEILGRVYWEVFPKTVGSRIEFEYRRAMSEQRPAHFTVFSPTMHVWLDINAYPAPEGLTIYFRDVSDRVEAEREEVRGREQQRAATELGQRALAGCEIDELRRETVRALMQTLHIDACEIRESVEGDARLRFVAGTHWLAGAIGREWVPLQSLPGFAFAGRATVVTDDLLTETRFVDRSIIEGGLQSGISVPIMHLEVALGVISVFFARCAPLF